MLVMTNYYAKNYADTICQSPLSHKDYKYFWKWKKKILCEIIGGAVAYPVL